MALLKITWRTRWELNHWPQVKSLWCVSRSGWLKEPLASLLYNLFILGGTQSPRGDLWITWLLSYPSLQTRSQTEAASGMATKAHVRKNRACRSKTSLIDGLREWKRWKKRNWRGERERCETCQPTPTKLLLLANAHLKHMMSFSGCICCFFPLHISRPSRHLKPVLLSCPRSFHWAQLSVLPTRHTVIHCHSLQLVKCMSSIYIPSSHLYTNAY